MNEEPLAGHFLASRIKASDVEERRPSSQSMNCRQRDFRVPAAFLSVVQMPT